MTTYPTLRVIPERTDSSPPDPRDVGYFNDLDAARRYSRLLMAEGGYVSTVIEGTGWNSDPEDETAPAAPGLTLIPGGAA